MSKKVLLLIAHENYQPIEYDVPKELLEKAGITVVTASNKKGVARATDGSVTAVDVVIDTLDPKLYDGIFIVGGAGALEALDNETVYEILRSNNLHHKPYGAICISVRILAKADMLAGKKATGWNKDGLLPGILKEYAATFVSENVVVDGNCITAVGPHAAQEFGQGILKLLTT